MKRLALSLSLAAAATPLLAQQQPPPPAAVPLAVGVEAPDFTLSAATLDGVGKKPLHLKKLRGKTVVLAFFFKARTSG